MAKCRYCDFFRTNFTVNGIKEIREALYFAKNCITVDRKSNDKIFLLMDEAIDKSSRLDSYIKLLERLETSLFAWEGELVTREDKKKKASIKDFVLNENGNDEN